MGLFDTVVLKDGLLLPDVGTVGADLPAEFQTKNLESQMGTYYLDKRGRLTHLVDIHYGGTLRLYATTGNREDGTWEEYDLRATFINGQMIAVERLCSPQRGTDGTH